MGEIQESCTIIVFVGTPRSRIYIAYYFVDSERNDKSSYSKNDSERRSNYIGDRNTIKIENIKLNLKKTLTETQLNKN